MNIATATPKRGSAARSVARSAPAFAPVMALLIAMAGVALLAGIEAVRSTQDVLLGIAAGGMAVLMLVSLLDTVGALGRR